MKLLVLALVSLLLTACGSKGPIVISTQLLGEAYTACGGIPTSFSVDADGPRVKVSCANGIAHTFLKTGQVEQ